MVSIAARLPEVLPPCWLFVERVRMERREIASCFGMFGVEHECLLYLFPDANAP